MSAAYLMTLLEVRLPLIQAPMAGSSGVRLAIAVSQAGGVGSLPCAMLSPEQIREQVQTFRAHAAGPLNLNFFTHVEAPLDTQRDAAWLDVLRPYFDELGLDAAPDPNAPSRAPFGETQCALIEELRPEIVSFHFGLPVQPLLDRVRAIGAKILSSATTLEEARFLDALHCDAIIAQGAEAGGHRGMFLSADIAMQPGTMALTPLVVDAVRAPVIASGGIADKRGVAAAFALGASGVQIGTAYLRAPECDTSAVHRAALATGGETALTNLFTGRPARGLINRIMRELGPMRADAPAFPRAAPFVLPLRKAAEARGDSAFSPLWAGEAFALAQEKDARAITAELMDDVA